MKEWLEPLLETAAEQMSADKNWLDGSLLIFVYGTGTFAQDVYRAMLQTGRHVSAYLDHRLPLPHSINDVPVMQPEAAQGAVVLLGIHNRDADMLSIIRRLEESGCKYIVSAVELYDFLGDLLGVRYWLTSRGFYNSFQSQIIEAYLLLSDEESRKLFSSVLRFRMTGDYKVLPVPDFAHQYFPPDLPAWKSPLRLIDCGAYDGDVIRNFKKSGYEIEALAALEPDIASFAKLSSFAIESLDNLHELVLFPCGAYSQTTQLHFSSGHGEASGITAKGDSIVQCIALDNALPNFAPTLIKMDIEGAELDALVGAKELITKNKPGLAISVYHAPEHLWQVLIFINESSNGNYTFHLRDHAYNCFDTVLYAIPIN